TADRLVRAARRLHTARDGGATLSDKRAAYLAVYALFSALGAALLARPALLTLRGLGLFSPALPWEVPLGWPALALLLALAAFTLRLAMGAALGEKPRLALHAAFLALLVAALAVRGL